MKNTMNRSLTIARIEADLASARAAYAERHGLVRAARTARIEADLASARAEYAARCL